ncbi:VWA domain-containing protein, partial [Myxococcota bacterium]|nr:VWA domain-containing protein [Myxococcota bacterium]
QGRIVRTEVEEEFHNDTATTMEGIYSFPLPADAKIAGLDLVVDGKWEHGAMVERSRGDKIWAGVIRNATPRKKHKSNIEYIWVPGPWRDPALLNWKQGSDFELKIFPIPAKGSRRVRIAYTQVLKPIPGGRRYVLPLAQSADGKAATERFRFEASVGGFDSADDLRVTPYEMKSETIGKSVVLKMDVPDFAPKGDIVVDVPSKKPDQELFAYAYRKPGDDKGYAMIALKPRLPFLVETQGLDLLLVVDTSYSIQKTRLERAARLVELMSTELGNKSRVAVMTCASTCKVQGTPFIHPDKSTAKTLRDTILAQRSLGSTRLSHMMEQAAAVLKKHGITGKNARIIYMGDGVPTVGELDAVRLATKAGDVLRGVRLTTVGLGGTVDEVTMRAMARACGGAFVNPVPGTSLRNVAYRILQRQWGHPLRNTSLTLPEGAVQVAPGKLGDVWPGEERLVAFRLDKNKVAGEVILKGKLETGDFTRTYKVTLRPELSAGNAFLPRMWAERRIDSLSGSKGEKAREEIVKISRKHHVLSRYTSLIVLESAAMAKAFGVEDTRPSVEWSGEAATEESAVESPMDSLAGGSGGFTKDFRSAPRKASRRPSSMGALSSKPRSFMDDEMPRRERFRRRRPGSFVAMRKVWYRVATVVRYPGPQAEDWSGLKRAELKRSENAQSRERNRDLVRALIKMGELDKAEKIANHWLSKDRLDAGALVELSSIAALRGDTELGTLYLDSALDVDPRNKAAHTRMFQVYRAAGNFSMMCDHAIARSILDGTNMDFAVEATRCDHDKARHFGKLSKHLQKRAENLVLKATNQGNMWERLMLDASWETNTDLDLVVISPSGRVISWLGGAKRTKTKGVKSTSAEKLSVSLEENGKYTILAVAQKGHTGRVKGTLKISSYNAFKAYPFDFTGQSVRVAEVSIRSKFRYERVR